MANDIDMWRDIEDLEKEGKQQEANDLLHCFNARYNEGNKELAETLKDNFRNKYGYWDNWY